VARDDIMQWIRDGITRDRDDRVIGGTASARTVDPTDPGHAYKRGDRAYDLRDTWVNLTRSTDINVMRMVDKMLTGDNSQLQDELMYTLCMQLMNLCYDFVVNIWVHARSDAFPDHAGTCGTQCVVLAETIRSMMRDIDFDFDTPNSIVEACVKVATNLKVAAKRVYNTTDSLTLQTRDSRALHPKRWTQHISASAMMDDGTWNEHVLIEHTIVDIYRARLSTLTPLAHIQHTKEWNQILRPADLDANKWEFEIPQGYMRRKIPVLDNIPFHAMYQHLVHRDVGGEDTMPVDILDSCTHALMRVMPGLDVVTFSHPRGFTLEADYIPTMVVQLSFKNIGETDDVDTVLVIPDEGIYMLVFERQTDRGAGAPARDKGDATWKNDDKIQYLLKKMYGKDMYELGDTYEDGDRYTPGDRVRESIYDLRDTDEYARTRGRDGKEASYDAVEDKEAYPPERGYDDGI